ncbi:MAG: Chromosome partitioning protein gp35 [Parcubacteria group bacterium GW2011_GWB1_56_8]|nr:MAG: Chromosome partitioning protein gp35 [Parcubacteria group bacterium GW2011_GWB1_56_8]
MSHAAIDAKREDLFSIEPERLSLIIEPTHPLYDPRVHLPLDPGFVANIDRRGVVTPIRVRKNGAALEVVAGRQRVRAAVEANKLRAARGDEALKVRVWLFRAEDDRALTGLMTAENLRTDDPPTMRARKCAKMLADGWVVEDVAVAWGCSAQSISNYLLLLDCDAGIQAACDAGTISETTARSLSKLDRSAQVEALDGMAATGATKGSAAEAAVTAVRQGRAVPKKGEAVERRVNRRTVEKFLAVIESSDRVRASTRAVAVPVLRWALGRADAELPADLAAVLSDVE